MKVNRKERKVVNIKYECEVCGSEFDGEDYALNCEKSHNCDHKNVYYKLGMTLNNDLLITKYCKNCEEDLDSAFVDDDGYRKDNSEMQTCLKTLFDGGTII